MKASEHGTLAAGSAIIASLMVLTSARAFASALPCFCYRHAIGGRNQYLIFANHMGSVGLEQDQEVGDGHWILLELVGNHREHTG